MPNRPLESILRKRLGQHPTPLDTDALWEQLEPRLPRERPPGSPWKWIISGVVLLLALAVVSPDPAVEETPLTAASPSPTAVTPAKTHPAPASAPTTVTRQLPNTPPPVSAVSRVTLPVTVTAAPQLVFSAAPDERPLPHYEPEPAHTSEPPVKTDRSALVSVPYLPRGRAAERVRSLYERITFSPPPPVFARALTVAPADRQPKFVKEEDRRAETGRIQQETLVKKHAVNTAGATAKAIRDRRKELAREGWREKRAAAKIAARVRKETARAESQERLNAMKVRKAREKLAREILKRYNKEYTKAERAKLREQAARQQKNRADRLSAGTLTKADRNLPGKFRERQSAYLTFTPGVAVSIPSRSVNVAGSNPNGDQVSVNNRFEKALEAVTVQGLIGYHRPNGLSLRTGLTLNRINSKVESVSVIPGTETVETTVYVINNPNGTRREQTGPVEVPTETRKSERYYNSVSSIDVPLLLGYRFSGNKWGFGVEAGPTFNLGSSGKAHLYDGVSAYRSVGGDHFRSRLVGRGFLATIGGGYRLSEKTTLTADLRIQGFGRGGFESLSTGYATKYTLIGLQLGYRVRL